MAWMIDGDVVTERLRGWLESPHGENVYNSGFDDAIWRVLDVIEHMPTLTPPAEDNNVPTNEPLTLEELREMDEPTPVRWEKAGYWCLCERGFIIAPNGNIYEFEETDGTFYRRPPEGEEEKS